MAEELHVTFDMLTGPMRGLVKQDLARALADFDEGRPRQFVKRGMVDWMIAQVARREGMEDATFFLFATFYAQLVQEAPQRELRVTKAVAEPFLRNMRQYKERGKHRRAEAVALAEELRAPLARYLKQIRRSAGPRPLATEVRELYEKVKGYAPGITTNLVRTLHPDPQPRVYNKTAASWRKRWQKKPRSSLKSTADR